MKRQLVKFIAVALLLSVVSCTAEQSEQEKAAVDSAKTWLSIVDKGNYAKSWDEAAAYFKGALKKDQWNSALTAARTPLGALVSRTVKNTAYKTALPDAPDGEYVVIVFESSFENKKTAIETVTPMMDADGSWRVSGYYIK